MFHRLVLILIFFLGVILLSVVYFFNSLFRGQRKWKEKIKINPKDRMTQSKKDFIDFYLRSGYENEVIDFVYNHTQKILKAQDIILLHSDDLVTLYERSEHEWFYILNRWLKELGYAEISLSDLKKKSDSLHFEDLIKVIQAKRS